MNLEISVNTFANASNEYKAKLGTAKTELARFNLSRSMGTDNNLALSGGVKWLPYRLSIGYNRTKWYFKTNEFKEQL